jgi:hypothetical protein
MELLNYTNEHQPTFIQDVIDSLIGKEITVLSHYAITGILLEFNGYLLHIHDSTDDRHYYVRLNSIEAVADKAWVVR